MNAWGIAAAGVVALAGIAHPGGAAAPRAESVGQSIYEYGVLASGAPIEATREAGTSAKGADAACVNCHQRSGLGSREGDISIPPITGEYLFHSRGRGADSPVLPYVESMHGNRDPYTDATLARAIRAGIDSEGRPLSYLMPRFALSDADMAALIEYLKDKLAVGSIPGVTDTVLHFATVFTPDADPAKRRGVLDVLEHYFAEKNSFPFGPSPRMWTSGKTQYSKSMYMANRRWQLHVWELTGPATTWRAQLEKHLREEPVYAVLSGVGGSDWSPVDEFCEQNAVPCLFPNVEVPVEAERGFYTLYFSKGVLLEAQLIAARIAGLQKDPPLLRVDQIYRTGDSGEPAARALAAELQARGIAIRNHALALGAAGRDLGVALRAQREAQVLVLWLRPADIAALGSPPPAQTTVYMSGLMGGLEETPLPPGWREHTLLAYPFDLPDRRGVRLDYPLGWFSFRHIPLVAEQVQADTYLACSLLSEVMKQMADSYARAYLIEQLQGMLEHRIMTGYYPHLALAYHQRFASKGGYIAHFSATGSTHLIADGDWIVP
jgi:Cytochrome c